MRNTGLSWLAFLLMVGLSALVVTRELGWWDIPDGPESHRPSYRINDRGEKVLWRQ